MKHEIIALKETGCDAYLPDFADAVGDLQKLYRYMDNGNPSLCMGQPWELSTLETDDLDLTLGESTVPGGWSRLVALAAGTDMLTASGLYFELNTGCNMPTCQDLVEAFTLKLAPPAAAAAVLVTLGIHFLEGLAIGRYTGISHAGSRVNTAPPSVTIVRSFITSIIEALVELDEGVSYSIDALVDVVHCAAKKATYYDLVNYSVVQLAVLDLLDLVFVPAGAAVRDEEHFAVMSGELRGINIIR